MAAWALVQTLPLCLYHILLAAGARILIGAGQASRVTGVALIGFRIRLSGTGERTSSICQKVPRTASKAVSGVRTSEAGVGALYAGLV